MDSSAQVPAHSSSSWQTHIGRRLSERIREVQMEVKKELQSQKMKVPSSSNGTSPQSPTSSRKTALAEADVKSEDIYESKEEPSEELLWDLQTITDFFAAEPEGADGELWEALEKKVSP